MAILDASSYRPPAAFRNRHINTIYPYFFRKKVEPSYRRERFTTSDGDFVDLDLLDSPESRKLVILCHGLEGSSESQYMQHLSSLLQDNGWNAMVFNYRSCSGEMNRKLQMYHSGWTTDLHEIISAYEEDYEEIALVGVSLGGNMILKYTCDEIYTLSRKLKSIVAISTPADLSKSSHQIIRTSNWLYDKRFRLTLTKKMEEKHKLFPKEIPIQKLKQVKNLMDFDEFFTGPLHGFAGAEDYYAKCHCKQFLHQAKLPTLMITAQDDPFLTKDSMVFEQARSSRWLHFLAPKFGGHVGFTTFGANNYWNENKTLQFMDNPHSFVDRHRIID